MKRTLLLFLLLAVFRTEAQSPSGVLAGRVRDPAGLPAPDAEVRIQALDRDMARSTRTDQEGAFRVNALPAGAYQLVIEHPGFARYELGRVDLQVRQVVELEISLTIGGRNEVVRVSSKVTPIDAAPLGVGLTIGESQIRQLPLDQRNFIGLAYLGPGVIPRHLSGFVHDINNDAQPGRGAVALNPPVNGIRSTANTFLLDGVLNTDGNMNALVVSPPLESIQEFRLQTSASSAEFGYSGGAVVSVVTRSGGAKLHGGVFDFFRNEKLDAHGFFDRSGRPKPAFRQNQFGGQAGGPAPRLPGWFFFSSYEGLRSTLGHSKPAPVPDVKLRAGDFSGRSPITDPSTGRPFLNNIIPPGRIDPAAKAFLDKFQPLPNGPNSTFIDSTPDQRSTDTASARLDKNTTRWGSFFGRYSINDDRARIAGGSPVLPSFENIRAQHLTLAHTLTGREKVNEMRLGFNRLSITELPESAYRRDVMGELGINGIDRDPANFGLPTFILTTYLLVVDDPTLPQTQHDQVFQFLDQFTARRGRHTWSVGGEIRRFQMNFMQRLNGRGNYTFSGAYTGDDFADFLLGLPQVTERLVGVPQAYLRQGAYAFYAQDEARLGPGLKLSAGLRYNYRPPFTEKRDNLYNLDYSTLPNPPALVRAGGKFGRSLVESDRNDFAPRFGLAWQPWQKGRRSAILFRGGYGIFYSPEAAVEIYDLVRNGVRHEINNSPTDRPLLTIRDGFPAGAGSSTGFASYFGLDRTAPTPYVQQWNAEWQVGLGGLLLEAAYVGTKGTHLGRHRNFNTPLQVELGKNLPPRPGDLQALRSFPSLGKLTQRQHIANSIYHSLQLRAEKRFSRSLQFQGSFTWAKSIDDSDNIIPGLYDSVGAQDERNLRLERGLSFFDVRKRLTSSVVYDLPFGAGHRWASSSSWRSQFLGGWQISGIVLLQDGTPENAYFFAADFANSGTPNRPNLVPGQKIALPRSQRTPERFFNTAAFSDPAPFTFGNAGRNLIIGPGNNFFDLAVHRQFRLTEAGNLEFRAEFFNAFNHPNWGIPVPNPDFGPYFGRILAVGSPRRIQLALKLNL